MHHRRLLGALLCLFAGLLPCSDAAPRSAAPSVNGNQTVFGYNATDFLLHGKPYQIIGGQIDPQRIPPQYWRDRLQRVRAMGLNTIFSYIFWDLLEPTPGSWTSNEPANDIATFFRIAQQEGLHVVLRPGGYICGEHDFGGFPAWLTQVDGLVVRDYNAPYLNATQKYLERLAQDLAPLQVTRGGPILMVQVENEYGSFGDNHKYIAAMRDLLRAQFEVPLYTNDGGVQFTLEGGTIPNVLAEIDGYPSGGFNARNLYVTNPTELGPLLDGEYYTWAPDQWGSYNPHNTTANNQGDVDGILNDIDFVLGQSNASMSFYMVHGGTNFGFDNGALWQNRTTVFTTSYDYGAPIDEAGRLTPLYTSMRNTILKYVPAGSVPDPPSDYPMMFVPSFELLPLSPLFENLAKAVSKPSPVPMEALGQSFGFILYEHTATGSSSGTVIPGDRPRDRVLVYVNGEVQGVIDSQYQHPRNISVKLNPHDKLQLLVENLGRVDYYSRGNPYADYLREPEKGIVGNITVGGQLLTGWDMYSLPLTNLPSSASPTPYNAQNNTQTPMFYRGTFEVPNAVKATDPATRDTFLAIPNGVKGQVFVNGFNLGRYWLVGPQQSLYLPGTLLHTNQPNKVVVLELEPQRVKGTMTAVGMATRKWFNKPDPDCLTCI